MRNRDFILYIASATFIIFPSHVHAQDSASTIIHALQAAYDRSPSLSAARIELEGTKELYQQARAGWKPTIGLQASIYASDVESSNFGTGNGATTKDLSLNIDQPIWRGGKTFAQTDRAESLIKAGEATLNQVEQ
jgi:outer membrane protein